MQATATHIRVGETFNLQIQATVFGAQIESFELPSLDAFDVIAHEQSASWSIGIGSGTKATINPKPAHALVLRARTAGRFKIEPAIVKVEGKQYRSKPLTVLVGEEGADTPAPSMDSNDPDTTSDAFDPKAFVRVVIDPRQPYVGQQVTVTVYLYSSGRVSLQTAHASKPSTDGFWVHDLDSDQIKSHVERIGGRAYRAYPLYRFAAFPLRAGALEIGSAEVEFDFSTPDWFSSGERLQRRAATTSIEVKPLPANMLPAAIVGTASLQASLDRSDVRTGDAVTLKLQAEGTGNPNSLSFSVAPIDGLRILQPQSSARNETPTAQVHTHRTHEWIIVAEKPGQYKLPPFELSVLDPSDGSVAKIATERLVLNVVGNAPLAATDITPTTSDSQSSPASLQLSPIRTQSNLVRERLFLHQQPWFRWTLALPPALFFATFLGLGWARRRASSRASSFEQASTGALQRASLFASQNDAKQFYDELAQSLLNALSYKLNASAQGMTQQELSERLRRRGADDDLTRRVIDELEGCDFARYSAVAADAEEMKTSLSRSRALIDRIGSLPQEDP